MLMSEHYQRSEGSRSRSQAWLDLTPHPAPVSQAYLDGIMQHAIIVATPGGYAPP